MPRGYKLYVYIEIYNELESAITYIRELPKEKADALIEFENRFLDRVLRYSLSTFVIFYSNNEAGNV